MAQTIEKQLGAILDKYSELSRETVLKCSRQAARGTAQKLRNTSPKRAKGGEYAASWSTRKYGKGYVVYNKEHYQLTHLLEYGHDIVNKFGEYGRAPAHVHIKPVADEYERQFIENVERELSK